MAQFNSRASCWNSNVESPAFSGNDICESSLDSGILVYIIGIGCVLCLDNVSKTGLFYAVPNYGQDNIRTGIVSLTGQGVECPAQNQSFVDVTLSNIEIARLGNDVLSCGGRKKMNPLLGTAVCWIYDKWTSTWNSTAAMINPRRNHKMVALNNSNVWMIGEINLFVKV